MEGHERGSTPGLLSRERGGSLRVRHPRRRKPRAHGRSAGKLGPVRPDAARRRRGVHGGRLRPSLRSRGGVPRHPGPGSDQPGDRRGRCVPRASVEQAALLIQKAARPVILAGNGVIRNGSSAELTQFAERLHIPVVTTVMGKGAIPWTSPMSLLTIGILPRDHELAGLDDSDLVICVGYDFVEYDPRSWNARGDRRIIHIDALPAEISAQYLPEVEVIGEIRESLQTLGQRIARERTSGRRSLPSRDGIMKTLESELGEHSGKVLNPQRTLWDLRDILEPDDLLISDVGAHKLWLSRFFRVAKPKTIIISNGLSPMGIAVPGGIAAKLMDPNRRVVTLSGDGGFLMSVHELETASRENAPTVNLVFRDGGLGSIRWKQMAKFQRTVGTEFNNPDFSDLAKAFGLRGFRVEHASELNSILREALESKVPCLVDVPVDYGTNPFLARAR